jgi:glucokinase
VFEGGFRTFISIMIAPATFLGIEIGGTKLQIVSGDAEGRIVETHRFEVVGELGAAGIQTTIASVLNEHYAGKISAVGVGFGGPVNRATGEIATSFHVSGWSGFLMRDWLQELIQVPVIIENDANVAALGEAICGAGRGYETVLYITLGSGVGGGLVVNQEIFHGASPGEMEVGHIQMDRYGTVLQSRCSGWAVDEQIRKSIANDRQGLLATLVGEVKKGEAKYLKAAIAANDITSMGIFENTVDDLAFGLSHVIHVTHPEILILGGGLSLMGPMLSEAVAHRLPRYLMSAFHPGPIVTLSELQEQSVPVGCLVLAGQHKLKNK